MKTPLFALLLSALSGLFIADAAAADSFKPDSAGYIRDWVMLAPIALPDGEACAEALFREQINDEAALRPKAGDTVKVGRKELTWQNVTASTNYFDFNTTLKSINDHVAGYMVTYIECDTDKPDVIMAVASNDQGRIYFNGVDIYAFSEARPLILDADRGKVTLKKGINVIVFKVINEQNSWQGAMRLLDQSGAPLKDIKIKLSP
ncbi:MAG: acetylxylan esterase [Verrucomicrobiales bacterium]|nr:acetylxylan esterase [Verrucomicrobiales bacterium]